MSEERVPTVACLGLTYHGFPSGPFLSDAFSGTGDLRASQVRSCGALYLVPQTLYKLHPDFDRIVAGVLRTDATGCAVFIQASDPWVTQGVSKRLSQALRDAGLMGPSRVFFTPRYVVHVLLLFFCTRIFSQLYFFPWLASSAIFPAVFVHMFCLIIVFRSLLFPFPPVTSLSPFLSFSFFCFRFHVLVVIVPRPHRARE